MPITTQVENWLAGLVQQSSTPSLIAIDGTPGKDGVTFVFGCTTESAVAKRGEGAWLDPEAAALGLSGKDKRFLLLTEGTS